MSENVEVPQEQGGQEAPVTEVPQTTEAPASTYEPNYRYKVLDQEKEFPDWVRPVVKDPDTEKNIREVFQKAEGLDHVKARREALEKELNVYKNEWGPVVQTAKQWWEAKEKKDYETLFERMGLSEDELFGYVSNRLDLRQNPQQYEAHRQARALQLQNQQLSQQAQYYEQQQQELAAQRRAWELDMELQKPEVTAVAREFDTRLGQAGAFRNEVIRRGQAYAAQGVDITPQQAAAEVLKIVSWQGGGQQAQTTAPTPIQNRPQTIPNIKGRGTSPAKLVPKSTSELRELARKMRS